MPIDPYKLTMRQFQNNLSRGVNHTNMTLEFMMLQMNLHQHYTHPAYPYIPSWEDLWRDKEEPEGVELGEKMKTSYPFYLFVFEVFNRILFFFILFCLVV